MTDDYLKKLQANGRYYYRGEHCLPRHAILHWMRRRIEDWYRWRLYRLACHPPSMYHPEIDQLYSLHDHLDSNKIRYTRDHNGPMRDESAHDFCNKTAPFYIVAERGDTGLMNRCLQNWLFQRWFIPYRTDIEYEQFIAKFISTTGRLPNDMTDRVDCIVQLNGRACAEADEQLGLMRRDGTPEDDSMWQIRPSFRAVAIVILLEHYPLYEGHVAQTPVWIVRTRDEEDLSAPIHLETIDKNAIVENVVGKDGKTRQAVQTSLENAYRFLSALDQREIAAFGHQPPPLTCKQGLWNLLACVEETKEAVEKDARRLGWEGEFTIEGPSSTWVDVDMYSQKFGGGSAPVLHLKDHGNRMFMVRAVSMMAFLVTHY